ncbi:MAG: hypothetical protein QOE36_982, partial [Gaiellaceae bacterium]|nr:hypothetical protein [Gaiellaceae bacterium]
MKRALLLAATIAALALGLSGTASAGTYTCTSSGTYPNANVAIHMSGNPSVVRLKVGANHELLVNDTHCTPLADLRKGPLVAITVASGSDNDGVLLDLSGGPFRDTTHNTDIFFAADLGSGSSDY